MSNKIIFTAMAALALISCNSKEASKYARDTFKTENGTEITFTYYGHASIGIEAFGKHIYIDPVGENIDWEGEPKADLILITHDHYDHLDTNAVKILSGKADGYTQMAVGTIIEPFEGITVEGSWLSIRRKGGMPGISSPLTASAYMYPAIPKTMRMFLP